MKMMSVYSNKAEAGKRVLLLLLAGTLAGCPLFAQNTSSAPLPQSVTVSYTMPVLSRTYGVSDEFMNGKTEMATVGILVGGTYR